MVRHKQRYLVVEITPQNVRKNLSLVIHSSALHQAILLKVQQLHGDFGAAAIRAGFTAKYFNEKTRIAIIRSRHGPHKLITSALPFIKDIDKKNVSLNTLYTGATLKHCFKFILNYQRKKVDEICATMKSEGDKVKEDLLDFKMALE
ncbi:hypothetical protein RN001_012068 [Aquatica leii]|uniref:Ribonuclease P/MRP protein subunit POP5 n=1 Tax=Aquatica leii TaxID=1421715 RepID=A0AAN7P6T6_9COLE|nr:hypothetical protein RN001_012068 [Aquatica leii]